LAAVKFADGLEVRHPDIEKKILERIEEKSKELNLPADAIKEVYEKLIEMAVDEQQKFTSKLTDRPKAGKCAIYGGTGGIGRLMCELLLAYGYDPVIVRSSGKVYSYPKMETAELNAEEIKFAFVSVPMRITGQMIEKAASDLPGKKIYEVCSMKDHLKQSISNVEKRGSEVISLHPMFGPNIRALENRPVIFCGLPDQFKEDPIWMAFKEEGANLLTISFESHDKMMSYILQLTHAVNLIYFTVLSNSSIDSKKMELAASPICARQMTNAKAVAQQDPELYFEIQKLSDHLGSLYGEIGTAQAELVEALASDSSMKFKELMKKGKKYFEGG